MRLQRWRTGALAVSGAVVLAVGVAMAGPVGAAGAAVDGAAPAVAPSITMQGETLVTLANGQKWDLAVGWFGGGDQSLELDLVKETAASGEEHSWQFNVPAKDFTFNSSTDGATLNTGTSASPVATLNLAFKKTSSKVATCTSGHDTTYSGTLTGSVKFVTGLAPAGTVGGSNVKFSVSPATVDVDAGCVSPPSGNDCSAGLIWDSGLGDSVPAADGGNVVANTDFTGVLRQVALKAPAKAIRVDVVSLNDKAPAYNSKTKVLTITTSTSGLITGSATISGGKVQSFSSTCKEAGKTYKVTTAVNSTAKYVSPPGSPIVGHTVLTGNLTVTSPSMPAFYEVITSTLT